MAGLSDTQRVLALNSGSSSIKYASFAPGEPAERGSLALEDDLTGRGAAHAREAERVLARLGAGSGPPVAIAHRIVHGGLTGASHRVIDEATMAALRRAVPFAPLHLPAEIAVIEAAQRVWSGVPQIACFDTAFHQTLPEEAARLPLPQALFAAGVRRWGFHGLSYEHVVASFGAALGSRTVVAHLGSGASLCAIASGVSIDTTMGFSPTGGLLMGTRCGDLDPGVLLHLLTHEHYDVARLNELVNHRSGLLALSGTTADVRTLLARRGSDARADLALRMFCRSVQKGIAEMATSLGGVDQLVFTGGIGAGSPELRREIVEGLAWLGAELDLDANDRGARCVNSQASVCAVFQVVADEEQVLVRHAIRLLGLRWPEGAFRDSSSPSASA